jgi:hypothetical protein
MYLFQFSVTYPQARVPDSLPPIAETMVLTLKAVESLVFDYFTSFETILHALKKPKRLSNLAGYLDYF